MIDDQRLTTTELLVMERKPIFIKLLAHPSYCNIAEGWHLIRYVFMGKKSIEVVDCDCYITEIDLSEYGRVWEAYLTELDEDDLEESWNGLASGMDSNDNVKYN